LGDHTDSINGLVASGYTAGSTNGNHFVIVNATNFASANLSDYSAIFVPSDHGGTLTEADLQALDARASDIISYLNSGGGLVAFAEDGDHTGGSSAQLFGFLPFLVTSTAFSEAENGNTLTAFGTGLGLASTDINGNFSHNVFTSTGGMKVVDMDAAGDILSLAFRGNIGITGVPEPGSLALLSAGLLGLLGTLRKKIMK
jgi:putative intracellular protease/amidase